MCGINGIAFSDGTRRVDESTLRRMRDVIHHRGPDDGGIFVEKNVGLGHRRLAIVDVSHGAQPMFNEDDSICIVYNGEIYNHADYRAELEAAGHVYKTHCDTETILHLYEKYGTKCVEKLRGMFAFAIWDGRKRELFIARDRLGVKPLYYVHDARGNLFFASEIKSLLEAKAVRPEINFSVLPDQLANHGTSGDETLFRDVKRLLPGHTLIWKDGRVDIEKFWDVSFEPKHEENKPDAAFVEEWRELFRKSVELRLMADVPLGMFLSGGIDSSAICAMMAQMVGEPIKTFSVGFSEREANELEYARTVARAFRTDHHEITVTPEEFFEALPKLIWHEDEPLGFIASVPLYFVSRLAQKHVKVVLTGEGSDEILGGYGRYRKTLALLKYGAKYEALTPRFLRELIKNNLENLPSGGKLQRTFLSRRADLENLYFDNFAIFSKAMQEKLLSAETKERIGEKNPYAVLQNYLAQTDARDLLDKLLYADTKTYLHELLMKQDQMSMAASIESRVPFLDHKLVEYTAKLPRRMKIRGRGETKWILREAMRGILPAEILNRPKMGFPVPVGKWFRNEFRHIVDEYVVHERALSRGIFNADFVREIVSRHNAGENHDQRLWFLVNFEMWQRQFIDGETPEKREVKFEEAVLI
jgi:asparagine synthase (glutamine-hydrolysing)